MEPLEECSNIPRPGIQKQNKMAKLEEWTKEAKVKHFRKLVGQANKVKDAIDKQAKFPGRFALDFTPSPESLGLLAGSANIRVRYREGACIDGRWPWFWNFCRPTPRGEKDSGLEEWGETKRAEYDAEIVRQALKITKVIDEQPGRQTFKLDFDPDPDCLDLLRTKFNTLVESPENLNQVASPLVILSPGRYAMPVAGRLFGTDRNWTWRFRWQKT